MQNTANVRILTSIKTIIGRIRLDISNKNEVQKRGMNYIIG